MTVLAILLATIPFVFGVTGVAVFCASNKDNDEIFAGMIQ